MMALLYETFMQIKYLQQGLLVAMLVYKIAVKKGDTIRNLFFILFISRKSTQKKIREKLFSTYTVHGLEI